MGKKWDTLNYWEGRKRILLLDGSQAMPARPSDNDWMRMKALRWWVLNACDKDDGIFISLSMNVEKDRRISKAEAHINICYVFGPYIKENTTLLTYKYQIAFAF